MMIASYVPGMVASCFRRVGTAHRPRWAVPTLLLPEYFSRVDQIEAEAAEQAQGGGVAFLDLYFGDLEELVLQVPKQQRDEILRQAAAAVRLGHLYVEDADRRGIPAGAEAL